MTKSLDRKINDYVRLDTLDTNVEKFIDEGYVNYVKRTGGQVNQFYSLSNAEEDSIGRYRETEVVFSREIFKRVILTTKLFPVGTVPDAITTSFAPHNKTKDDFYLRGRINPSTIEFAYASMAFAGGEFRNIRKDASTVDKATNTAMVFIGGEFRPPRFDFFPKPETILNNGVRFIGGMFKRALIHIRVDEQIQSRSMVFVENLYSTRNKNDVLELNFNSKNFPQESNKVNIQYINRNTTTLDGVTYLSGEYSLRTLSKTSGIIVKFSNSSTSMPYGKISLGLDFYLRDLTPGGYIFQSIGSEGFIKLNNLDGTQLEVYGGSETLITAPQTLKKETWYNLVIEADDTSGEDITKIFLNKELLFTYAGKSMIRSLVNEERWDYRGFVLGNNANKNSGVLVNIDRFYITKNSLVVSEDSNIQTTREIVAVDLNFENEDLTESVEGVTWTTDGPPSWVEKDGKKGYELIANSVYSSVSPDITITPANNYLIEVEVEPLRLPDVATTKRVILTDSQSAGYELSLVRYNNDVKVQFSYRGENNLISYSTIKLGKIYNIKAYKIRQYLILAIDDKFDNIMAYTVKDYGDNLYINPLTIGKNYNNSEHTFYGHLYKVKLTNFYRDTGLFDKYYPENISDIVVLNFEEQYLDEGGTYREWLETKPNLIVSDDKKFGDKSLKLGDGEAIHVERDSGLALGTNDFTFETWVKPIKRSVEEGVLITNGRSTLQDYAGLYPKIVITKDGKLAYKANARRDSTYFVSSVNSVPLNEWSHIAVVRDGNSMYLYINGKREATTLVPPPSIDLSYDGTYIGNTNLPDNGNTQYHGYIDSLRLVKGIPVYTTDTFDVPKLPASADINTSILRVTYEAPRDHTLLTNSQLIGGSVYGRSSFTQLSTKQNISSGSGTYVEDPNNARYKVSYEVEPSVYRRYHDVYEARITGKEYIDGTFTIKRAFYLDRDTPLTNIIAYSAQSTDHWMLCVKDKKLAIYEDQGTRRISPESTLNVEFETWYVLTLVKFGKRFLVFLDGTLVIDAEPELTRFVTGPQDNQILHAFKGNMNDIWFIKNAEYLDSHEVRYPLYFKNVYDQRFHSYHKNHGVQNVVGVRGEDFVHTQCVKLTEQLTRLYSFSSGGDTITVDASVRNLNLTVRYGSETYSHKIEHDFPIWDPILFTVCRSEGSTRFYLDGQLVGTTNISPSTDSPNNSVHFYSVNGRLYSYGVSSDTSRFNSTSPLLGSFISPFQEKERGVLEDIALDDYNVIPKGRVLDNNSIDSGLSLRASPASIWRTGAYFTGTGYQRIERMVRLPSNKFSLEFWFKPEEYGADIVNNYSLDKPELSYLHIKLTDEGFIEATLTSDTEESYTVKGTRKIAKKEWQHIRLSYSNGILGLAVNGTTDTTLNVPNVDFYVTSESTLIVGSNLFDKEKTLKGSIDYLKISRIPESLDIQERFNPLLEVFEESKIPYEDLEFPNLDFAYGLTYWKGSTDVVSDALAKSLTTNSTDVETVSYRLDLSNCIIDKTKIWVYFSQINEGSSVAGLTVRYFTDGDSPGSILIHEEFLKEITCPQETYRYISENVVLGTTAIDLVFSLDAGSTISNISVYFEEIYGIRLRVPTEKPPATLIKSEEEVDDYGYSFR